MSKRINIWLKLVALGCVAWPVAWSTDSRAKQPTLRVALHHRAQNPPLPDAAETSESSDRLKPIDAVLLPPTDERRMPQDFAAERFAEETPEFQPPGYTRPWPLFVRHWEAPGLCHRPLYFADDKLERYGYSHGWAQPAVSTAHFGGRVIALPALMVALPPHECIYTLGQERPGSCPP
jgi:hypothetical protein